MPQATTTTGTPSKPGPEAPPLPEMQLGLHINGAFTPSADGATSTVVNPANNRVVAEVSKGTAEDARRAIDHAWDAYHNPDWRDMDPSKRGKLLLQVADAVKARFNDFAVAEMLQNGKTLREAQGDIGFVINTLRYFAGLADKLHGQTIPVGPGRFDYTIREPLGVTAHIAPWNYPLLLSVRSIAPALAAGNTAILKPASWTPLTALLFAEATKTARLPDGVFQVVPGGGSDVGDALVRSPKVHSVAFTGSCGVGQHVLEAAAATTKHTLMELGGKSPVLAFPDASPGAVAKGVGWGIFANAGQMCWAGSRLIVHEAIADEVLQQLRVFTDKMTPRPGWHDDARMGPLVHKDHLATVERFVAKAHEEGASLLAGGKRVTDDACKAGNFLQPTVFTDVTPDMTLWKEEVFGPVLAVTTFQDEDEAIDLANQSDFGLWSGVWTRDISTAHRVASRIDAGMVGINEGPVTFPQTPFGGTKQSGLGAEQGTQVMNQYTRIKNVMLRL